MRDHCVQNVAWDLESVGAVEAEVLSAERFDAELAVVVGVVVPRAEQHEGGEVGGAAVEPVLHVLGDGAEVERELRRILGSQGRHRATRLARGADEASQCVDEGDGGLGLRPGLSLSAQRGWVRDR